jgi:hypothetical protein
VEIACWSRQTLPLCCSFVGLRALDGHCVAQPYCFDMCSERRSNIRIWRCQPSVVLFFKCNRIKLNRGRLVFEGCACQSVRLRRPQRRTRSFADGIIRKIWLTPIGQWKNLCGVIHKRDHGVLASKHAGSISSLAYGDEVGITSGAAILSSRSLFQPLLRQLRPRQRVVLRLECCLAPAAQIELRKQNFDLGEASAIEIAPSTKRYFELTLPEIDASYACFDLDLKSLSLVEIRGRSASRRMKPVLSVRASWFETRPKDRTSPKGGSDTVRRADC